LETSRGHAGEIDLVALENGGTVLATSDKFFGSAHNLLLPGRARTWATAGRRAGGAGRGTTGRSCAWVCAGTPRRVEVDTTHFKGNYPESCSLEACAAPEASVEELGASKAWRELVPRQKLSAHTRHVFEIELATLPDVSHVRLNIFPDGGVSRLRLFGEPSAAGRRATGLRWLDTLVPLQAELELLACCGSSAWAQAMARARPFATTQALETAADRIWSELAPADWLEAFSRHPRIGEQKAQKEAPAQAQRWSEGEQAGMRSASEATRAALAEANRAYQAKFGFVFLVCASGKTADELLSACRARVANTPEVELRTAAEEQRKITRLRLAKLVGAP
jgi:allantoicase